MRLAEFQNKAIEALAAVYPDSEARSIISLLIQERLGLPSYVPVTEPDREIETEQLEEDLERLLNNEPVQYVLGYAEFYGRRFRVTPDVLIPRPETEELIEAVLKSPVTAGHDPRILDLCTGSGCVGLSLLHYSTGTTLVATDISEAALTVARKNAEALGVAERAAFVRCDVFPGESEGTGTMNHFSQCSEQPVLSAEKRVIVPVPLTHRYDLIVANPPYIATDVIETLAPEVRCAEPRLALDGGSDGLAFYRRILDGAGDYLNPGGSLLVEIGYDQGSAVAEMFKGAGLRGVRVLRDLNGLDRVVVGER